MITVIDYGVGNQGALLNMLRHIGEEARTTADPEVVLKSSRLILPGVDSFDTAVARLNSIVGLKEALRRKVLLDGSPILGICLGMQLLTISSEEGCRQGLGWINGVVKRLPRIDGIKVPHMGWNRVIAQKEDPLCSSIDGLSRFYFVHSYYVSVDDPRDCLLKTSHGTEFCSAISSGNIYGVQFHPEKSHRFGMDLLQSFARL